MNNSENKKNYQDGMPELPSRKPGGLYRNVNMSVKTANILVVVCILLLAACMIFVVKHNGFTVSFDTNGGSYVESIKAMHGETVPAPESPVKEGWVFDGWYSDRACSQKWDISSDTVTESITLFAGWQKKTE